MKKILFFVSVFSTVFFSSCESEPSGFEVTYYYSQSDNQGNHYYKDMQGGAISFRGVRTTTVKTKILTDYKCPYRNTKFEYVLDGKSLHDWTKCIRCEYYFHNHEKQ